MKQFIIIAGVLLLVSTAVAYAEEPAKVDWQKRALTAEVLNAIAEDKRFEAVK